MSAHCSSDTEHIVVALSKSLVTVMHSECVVAVKQQPHGLHSDAH